MMLKKLVAAMVSAGMIISILGVTPQISTATTTFKFDLGGNGVADGFTGVSAAEGYSASKGYGFADTSNVRNVSANGSGAMSDAVQFIDLKQGGKARNTFNVDVETGLYQVTVTLGNTERTSIAAEGNLQIINMTGNGCKDTFKIPVTDGQLNISAVQGKENYAFTISAIEITKLSSDPTLPPTIWICGDSTVCNYYGGTRSGWGEWLSVDGFDVRNIASSGQFAKGFMDSGQYETIKTYAKPGDYYIISIGINDSNYSNETEYAQCLTAMTQEITAKGAKVVLVAQQGRDGDVANKYLNPDSGRWYAGSVKRIAAEEGVQCVDLYKLFYNHCDNANNTGGESAIKALYDGDGLHLSESGAKALANLVKGDINWTSLQPDPNLPVSNILNPANDLAAGFVSERTAINTSFALIASAENPVEVVASGLNYENNAFSQFVKLADTGSPSLFSIEITAKEAGYLAVFAASGNASQARGLVLQDSSGKNVGVNTVDGQIAQVNYSIPSAGKYYLSSTNNPVNVYYAEIGAGNAPVLDMPQIIEPTTTSTTSTTTTSTSTTTTISTTTSTSTTETVTTTATPEYGDIDLDGKVCDITDVVLLGKHLSGKLTLSSTSQNYKNCDVNQSNGVGIVDVDDLKTVIDVMLGAGNARLYFENLLVLETGLNF